MVMVHAVTDIVTCVDVHVVTVLRMVTVHTVLDSVTRGNDARGGRLCSMRCRCMQ